MRALLPRAGLSALIAVLGLLASAAALRADPLHLPCGDVIQVRHGSVWPVSCASCPDAVTLAVGIRVLRRNAAGGEGESAWVAVGDGGDGGFISDAAIRFGGCSPLALRAVEQALDDLTLPDASDLATERQRLRAALARRLPYHLAAEVRLAPAVELRVHELAQQFRRRGGRRLLVTSGIRGPFRQARAMFVKLLLGSRVIGFYRQRKAAREIVAAYRYARRRRLPRADVIRAMQTVIEAQVCRGVYISEHLKAGAVDLRSRGLRWREKRALRHAARTFGRQLYIKEERRPPHFHLAFRQLGSEPPRPGYCGLPPATTAPAAAAKTPLSRPAPTWTR